MIEINKGDRPNYLNSNDLGLAIEKLDEFYLSKSRNQKRYNFPFIKKIDKELKPILFDLFHGKCGYCETKIDSPASGIIDRYRPYNGVRDESVYYEDLYWWLTYDWENLIYSCKDCSQYKANYFPVEGVRVQSKEEGIEIENTLLVNPCSEEPSKYFFFDTKGQIYSNEKKGSQTIELLRLNRTDLVESRKKARDGIIEIIKKLVMAAASNSFPAEEMEFLKNIFEKEDPFIEFSSFKRWTLLKELKTTPYLRKVLDIEDDLRDQSWSNEFNDSPDYKTTKESYLKSDYFPIEYVDIENFKSISKLKINFREDEIGKKSWLFLLGENGVGKSSILQAIALGLKNNIKGEDISKYSLVQKRKQKAIIKIKERNSNNIIETILIRKDNIVEQKGKFDSFLLGYGSLRLSSAEVNLESRNDLRKVSYVNLFNPILALNDVTVWLKKIFKNDKLLFDRVAYAIKNLLPHDYVDNELTIENGKIVFKNSEVLFSELSDGFKSTIVLAVDIMMKLSSANSDFDKVSGIVIIDELGNQLHPRWQMRIVTQFRLVFPNINFVVSTHHPLCLRGAEEKEILLLKNINNEVFSTNELPDPSSLRVDQILASEFFGLNSLIDPELEANFNRYYELLAKSDKIEKIEKIELNKLKDDLRNKKQLGSTLREELMYHAIDKLLATKVSYNVEVIKRQELKEEVVQRVSDIWNNLKLDEND